MKILIKEGIVKKMVNRVLGFDLTDHIEMITSWDELGRIEQRELYSDNKSLCNYNLNNHGPMYFLSLNDKRYILQYRYGDWVIYGRNNFRYNSMTEEMFLDDIGLGFMGIKLQQIMDEFVEE